MASWSAADIPALSGRTAVVTGANSGLGFHTALGLARHGAAVTLACRNRDRGADALQRLRDLAPGADLTLDALDLADLASVRAFAGAFAERCGRLDILVNNAGVMAIPARVTADGFEMQFGTNHLGHFALTGLLLPVLLASPSARVVTVSSTAHRMGRIDFANLAGERSYSKWLAYGQSKLANLLFMRELARRADAANAALTSAAAHPGLAVTNLQGVGPRMTGGIAGRVMGLGSEAVTRVVGQPDHQGAEPSLYAATMPDVRGGEYFGPDGPFEQRGHPKRVGMTARARDTATGERLWAESERLTGVSYDAFGPR
jgi:NAD(P)-dependent dehydrogenase (short-subunit alcohol dehydrogenase family)